MTAEKKFGVFCFEAATGKPIWKREFETGKLPNITPPNSHATSTPVRTGIAFIFISARWACWRWICRMVRQSGTNRCQCLLNLMDWGAAVSPIVYQDKVIFNQDDDLSPMLYAFDSKTGNEIWKTERPEMLAGYAVR